MSDDSPAAIPSLKFRSDGRYYIEFEVLGEDIMVTVENANDDVFPIFAQFSFLPADWHLLQAFVEAELQRGK